MRGRTFWLLFALLLAGCVPAGSEDRIAGGGAAEEGEIVGELREHREALRARWEALGGRAEGLERYARFVQAVVDEAAAGADAGDGGEEGSEARKLAFLDDLVDLSVPPDYENVKRSVMVSPPAYRGPLVHEDESGLEGFAGRFLAGEGRYRHLAMSAAAAFRYPRPLVDIAARLVGHDLEPRERAEGDSAADLATNEVGRRFAVFLRDTPLERLADGETVAAWLRDALGE